MASGISLEMNWLPLQTRKGCPLGLKNLGNSCYLNSVLQCLTYTPPLANFCLLNHHSSSCTFTNGTSSLICLFCILEKRISRSLSVDSVSESPARIHSCLTLFAKHFRQGWQEDAHEFLRYVIEACNSVCVKLHKVLSASKLRTRQDSQKLFKEEPRTVVKDIFGGILQSQVKCLSCKAESNKLDEMMDLSLDVFKMSSVSDALCRYFQPEILDGSNKYKCEKCKKLSSARKQMSVSQAPNVLVIQLKRFENFFGGKIDRHISFEEHLELSGHMCHGSQEQRPEYLLYAVIVHAGHSQDSGHYYSYVKDVHGKWFCCNDAHVTSVGAKSVLSEKAYILFYVRKTTKPVMIKGFGASQNGNTSDSVADKSRVATILKEPPVKENGFIQKSNSPSGFTGKDSNVHQVRFNLVKPGLNGQTRKPFGNENGRAGNPSKDLGQTKRLLGASSVVSNGSMEDSVSFKIDTTECPKRGLETQSHGATSNGNQHQSFPANGSSHVSSELSGTQCEGLEPKENGHYSEVPPLRQEAQTEVVSNGGHTRGCSTEEVPKSSIDGLKPQHALVQERVAACSLSDGCKTVDKPDTRLSNGGGKAKSLSGSHVNQDKHSQDIRVGMTNHAAPNETGLSEVLSSEELKIRLASESREWLLKSGWCDTVRNSFRQLKRERLSDGSECIVKRKTLRIEVFGSVHDSLRQKVPKELKEYLVKQLHGHFSSDRLKNT